MNKLENQIVELMAAMRQQLPPFMTVEKVNFLVLRVRSVQFGEDDAYIHLPKINDSPAFVRFTSHGDGDILGTSCTIMLPYWPERVQEAADNLCIAARVVLPPFAV